MLDPEPRTLSSEELALFNELLSSQFGFHFPNQKRDILASRLRPRLEQLGLRRYLDYYIKIATGTIEGKQELAALVQVLTNNETYFFRETAQLDALFGPGLEHLRPASGRLETLRLVSVGCSSGEEAYTLRFFVADHQYQLSGCTVAIDAFDLDEQRIRVAREAIYSPNSLRGLSEETIGRHFHRIAPKQYQVRPFYRHGIRFCVANLLDGSFFTLPSVYDTVLCRNVLIYFTEQALLRAVERFAYCLRPGGLLFLGHSESIIGKTNLFEPIKLGKVIAYRKI